MLQPRHPVVIHHAGPASDADKWSAIWSDTRATYWSHIHSQLMQSLRKTKNLSLELVLCFIQTFLQEKANLSNLTLKRVTICSICTIYNSRAYIWKQFALKSYVFNCFVTASIAVLARNNSLSHVVQIRYLLNCSNL